MSANAQSLLFGISHIHIHIGTHFYADGLGWVSPTDRGATSGLPGEKAKLGQTNEGGGGSDLK